MASLGILHLTTFLQGGAGRAIADLACAQQAAGHRVTVVTSDTAHGEFGNYREYLDRLRAADVALHLCDSLFSREDRKSTRLNSSHSQISYAVFCLKKKKNKVITP